MSLQKDVHDFLTSRRARLTPEGAGLPHYGEKRRVPGLRREEVALLAGVSVDYYNRLERGNLRGVSPSVLEAVCRALHLDEAEQVHLHDLARAASGAPNKQLPAPAHVRPGVQRLLDTMTDSAAVVFNPWMNILATNLLGRALFTHAIHGPADSNLARFAFLDPRAHDFYPDWAAAADDAVAALRSATGGLPGDRRLSPLIDELTRGSKDFESRWATHDVRFLRTGTKSMHHHVVGDVTLSFEALEISADPGLVIMAYSAAAGSAAESALRSLRDGAAVRMDEPVVSR